ncbi:MAG: biotin/lipoyl-binding protein [Anaerolineae bacterium]|nr:biotin/lipoyl-binding protein [Anaerolineae bacterium]
MRYVTTVNGREYTVEINREGEIIIDGARRAVDFRALDAEARLYSLLIAQGSFEALVEAPPGRISRAHARFALNVHVADEREQHLSRAKFVPPSGDLSINAPMPGLIQEIRVAVGQEVEEGATLLILESMKMGNEIKAPRAGKVSYLHVAPGDSVEQGQTMMVIS